ncbi:hypothetical protein ACSTJ6_16590 [Vibrio parahaemolyticus]
MMGTVFTIFMLVISLALFGMKKRKSSLQRGESLSENGINDYTMSGHEPAQSWAKFHPCTPRQTSK